MVNKLTTLILILLLPILAGCTPTTAEDNAAPLEPAVEEVPMDAEEDGLNTAVPTPTPPAAAGEDESAPDVQTSSPTTVDLGDITPEANEDGELIVQPAPGRPDPANAENQLVQEITANLSQRLGIDVADIELVALAETEWPDSSLGCPQPETAYMQVITPGYRVTLSANGLEYVYHTRDTSHFILCQPTTLDQPITQPPAPDQ